MNYSDVVHHIFYVSSGKEKVTACGVDPHDDSHDPSEFSTRIDFVNCKECMDFWQAKYEADIEKKTRIPDGPVPA